MTICRRWTTAICAAAGRRCTRRPTTPPRSSPATALLTLAFDIVTRDEIHNDADGAPAADARAGAGLGHRRHGRRPDARPRRRGPVRRPRAGRRGAAAADEDRRAVALWLHRRRDPRPVLAEGIPGARRLRPRARRGLPDRRRSARRRGRRGGARQADRRRMRRSARPPSSPSSASTAPSSACAICWHAPIPRFRSSAPRATCCGQPRASSRSARTERMPRRRMSKEFDEHLVRFRKLPLPVRVVYARPRTFIAIAVGIIAFFLLPGYAAAGDAACRSAGTYSPRCISCSPTS